MKMKIITGHTGTQHIQSADDASYNLGVVSAGNVVLKTGKMLSAQQMSGNVIRISSGDIVCKGRHARIETYEDIKIPNGAQGISRTDAIVARYEKDEGTGVESMNLRVVRGGNGSAAVPIDGDMLLYHVTLSGVNIVSIVPQFQILMTITDLEAFLHAVDQKLQRQAADNYNGLLNRIHDTALSLSTEINRSNESFNNTINSVQADTNNMLTSANIRIGNIRTELMREIGSVEARLVKMIDSLK